MLDAPDRKMGRGAEFDEKLRAARLAQFSTPSEILRQMSQMTTGARALGAAADVLCEMFKECSLKVLTLSGVASVGKLDYIISELIDGGHINCIVSTGAVITHGCSYEMGGNFFKIDEEKVDEHVDTALYNRGYNRVYDTVELETSLENTGDLVNDALEIWDDEDTISSAELHCCLGRLLNERYVKEDGILHAAARAEIPIFVPSFTDSEIGLSFARFHIVHPESKIRFDAIKDLDCYASIVKRCAEDGPLGILTLGGGVPRNWAQQIGPFFDTLQDRGLIKLKKPIRFQYGVRICPEFREWGGLSGCTYSEGISWGKFVPTAEGGKYAEVYSDYTTVFPLLISGVMDRL